ncbi:pancreatic secretory trypsin inhibitor-like [Serinus canaria]|uniref:Pancreatic secretory trypsin inhibitor-like n=1 Tax=Serinus canaria TaxID=9135 RepID=A0A8C9NHF9_SERCA|nr:pancreatic secretory trypsin inhibitor-like [Serinus canaria]
MKAAGVFLLLSLALFFYQGIAEMDEAAFRGMEPSCENFDLGRGCTREFDPICGTDNNLYSNECLLCLHNRHRNGHVLIRNRGMCKTPRNNVA